MLGIDARGASFDEANMEGAAACLFAADGRQFFERQSRKGGSDGRRRSPGSKLPDRSAARRRLQRRATAVRRFLQRVHAGRAVGPCAAARRGAAGCRSRRRVACACAARRRRHDGCQDVGDRSQGRACLDDRAARAGPTGIADLSEICRWSRWTSPMSRGLTSMLERIDNKRVRGQVKDALAPILDVSESRKWAGTPRQARWQALVSLRLPRRNRRNSGCA